jgi:hypothetical protein
MSQHIIKTEDGSTFSDLKSSPATEALDFMNDDPNSLMFDLTELLKRDPTLSTLSNVKEEPGFTGFTQQQQMLIQQQQGSTI